MTYQTAQFFEPTRVTVSECVFRSSKFAPPSAPADVFMNSPDFFTNFMDAHFQWLGHGFPGFGGS
jgi:hypothetical protein